jgi:hypothetical protein
MPERPLASGAENERRLQAPSMSGGRVTVWRHGHGDAGAIPAQQLPTGQAARPRLPFASKTAPRHGLSRPRSRICSLPEDSLGEE